MEMFENLEVSHDYKTPYLRRHRFHEAVAYHKVVPLWPRGCHDPDIITRELFDRTTDCDAIAYFDFREPEVGFPPKLNGVTVIEVYTATGLEQILDLEVDDTPRVWTPQARYYLFKFVEPSERVPPEFLGPGLRWLRDDEWMPYPGTMIDGQLVHWEVSPNDFDPMPLPGELRNRDALKA